MDAGAPAHDLLELDHGLDALVEHDELAGLGVHAGRQELRGGGDDRIAALGVDEVIQRPLALVVVAGDADDELAEVARLLRHPAGDLVDQGRPHPLGVVDVLAEDDGLGVGVGAHEVRR